MLKKSRLYFSAMCAALVLVSLLLTSTARACEEEPPTLLTLYMNSDLVVLARYESNGESKKSFEDEYGYTLDTERKLSLTKIYKGQTGFENGFVFVFRISFESDDFGNRFRRIRSRIRRLFRPFKNKNRRRISVLFYPKIRKPANTMWRIICRA